MSKVAQKVEASMDDRLTAMERQIAQLVGIVSSVVEHRSSPAPEPKVIDVDSMSDSEVRKACIDNGVEVKARGAVSKDTRDALRSKLGQTTTATTPPPAKGEVIHTRFGDAPVSKGERDNTLVSAKDAAEALVNHPMRNKVPGITREEWRVIRSHGAEIKKNGQGTGEFRPNPANITPGDRRIAHMFAVRGESKPLGEWLQYQGCLILDKYAAAGFKF